MQETPLRTAKEAREWLEAHGVSQWEFARRIGVGRLVIVSLLAGKAKALWGDCHTAAIALGMKRDPYALPGDPLPPMPTRQTARRRAKRTPAESAPKDDAAIQPTM